MAQIAATTTLTSTIARSTRPTVPSGTRASAGGIWDSIKQDLQSGLSHKGKNLRPAGAGDGGDGGSGGGGNFGGDPGDRGNPGGGGNPGGNLDEDQGRNCLIGKEPNVFNGDRTKVEGFITKWKIYYGLNQRTHTMRNPFIRTFIFLGYIRGPHVHKWVDNQTQEVYCYVWESINLNADWHEHIWDHMINDFAQTYQDIMSKGRANAELNTLKMEKGELDKYTSRFWHLAHMAMYRETDRKLCKDYFRGLPIGLQKTMVQMEPMDQYQELNDWIKWAIRHHCKFLQFQAYFGNPSGNKNNPPPHPTKQQWQQSFAKDTNAMDTSAGCTHAQAAMTKDKKATSWKKGGVSIARIQVTKAGSVPIRRIAPKSGWGKLKKTPKIRKNPLVL